MISGYDSILIHEAIGADCIKPEERAKILILYEIMLQLTKINSELKRKK